MNGERGLVDTGQECSISAPTVSERLAQEEKALTERLDKIREIRQRLAENSEVQKLIDGLTSLGQFHY